MLIECLRDDFVKYLEIRSILLNVIRDFFLKNNFIEVETPIIIKNPCIEDNIDAIKCSNNYLRTSPELYHKRILSSGISKIFEIGKCFRDKEIGKLHHPEYTMLEWYRLNSDYNIMLDDISKIIEIVCNEFNREVPPKKIFSVQEIFKKLTNWDPIYSFDKDKFNDLLVSVVEPYFKKTKGLIFLKDFPIELAALSKSSDKNRKLAERWELYIDGIEIANAYSELTDINEQESRFIECQKERYKQGKEIYQIDQKFLQSLSLIPSAGGCALGIDRLLLWILNKDSLNDLVFREVFKFHG